MGTLYVQTTGSASNSGSTDGNSADLSGSAATVSTNVITLDGSPDLSGLFTSGSNQSTIYLANANNANRKIFWITGFDNTAKTVTVDATIANPSLSSSPTAWAIGGRITLAALTGFESCIRAGDTVQVNDSPASLAGTLLQARNAGNDTSGYVRVVGKSGVRPVFTCTNTSTAINLNNIALWRLENIEVAQQGASGAAVASPGSGTTFFNFKISDAGGDGVTLGSSDGVRFLFCEISGCGLEGIDCGSNSGVIVYGCNIHDNGGSGFSGGNGNGRYFIFRSIFDSNATRGIYFAGATSTFSSPCIVEGCSIYGNNMSGIEVADPQFNMVLLNSILKDNGDTGTEYNFLMTTTPYKYISEGFYNIFDASGARGGGNRSNYDLHASEIDDDPEFSDAAGADFNLDVTSPALGAGMPTYPGLLT